MWFHFLQAKKEPGATPKKETIKKESATTPKKETAKKEPKKPAKRAKKDVSL